MHKLTRKEEMIMMAILNLEEEAYLVAITDYLTKLTPLIYLLTGWNRRD